MTILKTMSKIAAVAVVAISSVGCEQDFESLGSNIIGDPGFNADLYDEAEIQVVSHKLPAVQTNNTPVKLLGYYDHQVFGKQSANILTQLSLSTTNPEFGNEPQLDSVVLSIPYFSTEEAPDVDGNLVYSLDSIIGNSPIKLTIEESNFFLNQFDPETNFETAQKYYSDMGPRIEENLTGNVLFESESFLPSNTSITEYGLNDEGERDTLTLAPALRVKLSNDFFQNKIIAKEGSSELSSNSSFWTYLRGIYIKAEAIGANGSMMLLNLNQANAGVTMYYTNQEVDVNDTDADDDTTDTISVPRSYKLNFGSGMLNTFEQETPDFSPENIYLRGGAGSMAVIELFGGTNAGNDEVSAELQLLRDNNWLINEANLTFYVEQNLMQGSKEPERLYLYDLNNDRVLLDYIFESPGQQNGANSMANLNHLVPLERDEDGNGVQYKIRLTQHVNNLLNRDSTNVKLGLVVSENVNLISNSAVRGTSIPEVDKVPTSSVISPLGTVLYGPDAVEEDKRMKLRIYYTESKN